MAQIDEINPAARPRAFTKDLKVFLTPEQDNWLGKEVTRRLGLLNDGKMEEAFEGLSVEAHGGNRNINKGMLIREAVERYRKS